MKKLIYILLILPILAFGQDEDPCYSINDYNLLTELYNPQIEINLVSGWNMIGYPCTQEVIVSDAFSSIADKITIVKDNNGNVYMPEFSFNGIGFLEGGQGYQIKMTDFVLGFTFCQSIQFPTIEGCKDCEASNFSKLATIEDGSCYYDSDGDGILDSLEIIGCQDSTACNYNPSSTDAGECSYNDQYFNCDGTPQIGAYYQGGIVFFYDEIDQRGLVVSESDIIDGASDPYGFYYNGFEWGCYVDTFLNNSNAGFGFGKLNSELILNSNCETDYGGITAFNAANNYQNDGYDDWFVPSYDELSYLYSQANFLPTQFTDWWYWTSTEYNTHTSYLINFGTGVHSNEQSKQSTLLVRPVRAFGNWTMGCMDENACNFGPGANMADESCMYPQQGVDCDGNLTAQVGDFVAGGILFYKSGQNGLVASTDGSIDYYQWGCMGSGVFGADETSIGTGYQNTMDIVNDGCTTTTNSNLTAAQAALNYESNGYDDWYIPSKYELQTIFNVFGADMFNHHDIWSSSEYDHNSAWNINEDGWMHPAQKHDNRALLPIRSF